MEENYGADIETQKKVIKHIRPLIERDKSLPKEELDKWRKFIDKAELRIVKNDKMVGKNSKDEGNNGKVSKNPIVEGISTETIVLDKNDESR